MLDGIFRNPTEVYFGRNPELNVGDLVKKHSDKILLHYGGSSFKEHGLFDKVANSLKNAGVEFMEVGGVKSNPEADLVYKSIDVCRKEGINFILAVGGGSVIDSAKAIGIGVPYSGDFFDFFEKKQKPQESLKVGVILTIPGSGSETSDSAVITHSDLKKKYDCNGPFMFPVFAILNPEITVTVPKFYTSCGIVDAISHILERYFSNTPYVDCTSRIGEGLIKTLMKYAKIVDKEPDNYDVRAEIMWASKLAQDNTAGFGRKQDWAVHKISHEIAARYPNAHGAILSVVFPAWMRYVYKANEDMFLQFAGQVFNIKIDSVNSDEAIISAIDEFKQFLKAIGMPSTLRELGLETKAEFNDIAKKSTALMESGTLGNFKRLSVGDIEAVLDLCF